MRTYEPTRPLSKVKNSSAASGAVALAITVIVLWAIDTYTDADLPVAVQAAISTLISAILGGVTYLVGYFTSIKFGEIKPVITPETEQRGRVDPRI